MSGVLQPENSFSLFMLDLCRVLYVKSPYDNLLYLLHNLSHTDLDILRLGTSLSKNLI